MGYAARVSRKMRPASSSNWPDRQSVRPIERARAVPQPVLPLDRQVIAKLAHAHRGIRTVFGKKFRRDSNLDNPRKQKIVAAGRQRQLPRDRTIGEQGANKAGCDCDCGPTQRRLRKMESCRQWGQGGKESNHPDTECKRQDVRRDRDARRRPARCIPKRSGAPCERAASTMTALRRSRARRARAAPRTIAPGQSGEREADVQDKHRLPAETENHHRG